MRDVAAHLTLQQLTLGQGLRAPADRHVVAREGRRPAFGSPELLDLAGIGVGVPEPADQAEPLVDDAVVDVGLADLDGRPGRGERGHHERHGRGPGERGAVSEGEFDLSGARDAANPVVPLALVLLLTSAAFCEDQEPGGQATLELGNIRFYRAE